MRGYAQISGTKLHPVPIIIGTIVNDKKDTFFNNKMLRPELLVKFPKAEFVKITELASTEQAKASLKSSQYVASFIK